jgi:hypothetical protein
LAALFLPFLVAGCGTANFGKMEPKPVVELSASCELPLQGGVSHYPTVPDKTDARVAWKGERSRLDLANDKMQASLECQELQRKQLANGGTDAGAR